MSRFVLAAAVGHHHDVESAESGDGIVDGDAVLVYVCVHV